MTAMIRPLIALLVISCCGVLQAAPLLYFTLEGRKDGSTDAFSSSIDVALGDVIEYRLQLQMAPFGTHNQYLRGKSFSNDYKHGVNSLSLAMSQAPTDPIQVDFGSPAVLRGDTAPSVADGWHRGTSARGGEPTPRLGTNWHDLLDIRPIHAPGVFTLDDHETIYTGAFTVATLADDADDWGQVLAKWGPVSGAGALYDNSFFLTGSRHANGGLGPDGNLLPPSELSSDPIAHFTPLTLTANGLAAVPEPSTIVLLGSALLGLTCLRRKLRG